VKDHLMNRSTRAAVALLLLDTPATAQRPRTAPADLDRAAAMIQPYWISSHVRALADDAMEGRETSTRGGWLAAKYVAAQFESYGLESLPGAANFLQRVPLRRARVIDGSASMAIVAGGTRKELEVGKDFIVHADLIGPRVAWAAPAVFVGFGLTVPEQGYDDYAGIDVKGKVVVMMPGGPASVPSDLRGHYSLLQAKEENALARGAVGIVNVFPLPPATVREKVERQLDGFAWLDSSGAPHTRFFELGAAARLTFDGADALFRAAGRGLPAVLEALGSGKPQSFDLGVSLELRAEFAHADTAAANAVGVLRGRDPTLRDEFVVYSAHLDHVGIGPAVNGDSVYHGAIDNAGGTATLIALARAFASLPERPRRSIIFVAVTGEEKGILGSDYFVHHPPVPLERLVANVNMDNYVMLYPIRDFVVYGAQYSTLGKVAETELGRLGIATSPDPAPEQTIFTRSDHYTFMRRGIPGLMLFTGIASGDGAGRDGSRVLRDWLGRIHHTPRDVVDQAIDWNAAVTYARANFLIGRAVANGERPRWNGTYFFQDRQLKP